MRKRSIERAFWKVTQSTAGLTGGGFYLPLATSLANALGVDHVFLTERVGTASAYLRSLALVRFKRPAANIEYDCSGKPCERVIAGKEIVYSGNLRKRFPLSEELDFLDADSFAGVPLKSLSKNILGHLAVMTRGPLPDAKEILPVLRVFATRAAAEIERQETDQLLKTLVTSMDEVFWLFSNDFTRVLYASPGIERVRGVTAEAIYRTPSLWLSTILPEDRVRVETLLRRRPFTHPLEFEYRIRLPDGAVRTIRDRMYPYGNPGSSEALYCGISEDATERLAEARELERSRKFSAMGQMAGSVTHDFKTVLTVMRCAIGLLEEEPNASSTVRQIAGMLTTACDQGMALTSQLLAFTRQKEGPLTALDVNPIVRQTADLLSRLMKTEIEIVLTLQEDAPEVLADRCQLEQLLTNLVLNARDAMPAGGTITIRTHRSAIADHPPRPALLVSVTDTGTGMDKETLDKASQAFFTTKEEGRGSGLGLTTVRNIVARHKGELSIESTPGKGTRVAVLLPLAEAPA